MHSLLVLRVRRLLPNISPGVPLVTLNVACAPCENDSCRLRAYGVQKRPDIVMNATVMQSKLSSGPTKRFVKSGPLKSGIFLYVPPHCVPKKNTTFLFLLRIYLKRVSKFPHFYFLIYNKNSFNSLSYL